ncbi:hypothetical protein F5879DRAFT_756184 [Lentinula edodes]|nr:hypothetical protein F5879DRAFT_756184 [Lentinula edodes]
MAGEAKACLPKTALAMCALACLSNPAADYDFDACKPSMEMIAALTALFSLVYNFQMQHNCLATYLFFFRNQTDQILVENASGSKLLHCHWRLESETVSLIARRPSTNHIIFQAWAFSIISSHHSILYFFMQAFLQAPFDPAHICITFLIKHILNHSTILFMALCVTLCKTWVGIGLRVGFGIMGLCCSMLRAGWSYGNCDRGQE